MLEILKITTECKYCEIYPSAVFKEKWFVQRTYGTFPPPFLLRLAEEQISL